MAAFTDPISGTIGTLLTHGLEKNLWVRVQLVLELAVAAIVSFLVFCGLALIARQPVAFAIGTGMLAAGLAMLATFQASPNSKGMTLALPKDVTDQAAETPTTTIKEK